MLPEVVPRVLSLVTVPDGGDRPADGFRHSVRNTSVTGRPGRRPTRSAIAQTASHQPRPGTSVISTPGRIVAPHIGHWLVRRAFIQRVALRIVPAAFCCDLRGFGPQAVRPGI